MVPLSCLLSRARAVVGPCTHRQQERAIGVTDDTFGPVLAVIKLLEADPAKVNVRGGAIAIGHPLGGSGARIATTLIHLMEDRQAALGLATMCIGAGQGIATIFEKV